MTVSYIERTLEGNNVDQAQPSSGKLSYKKQYDQEHCEMSCSSAKAVAVLSYLTLLGWLIALLIFGHHKSSFATFHLRQSLGLIVTGALLALIPLIGWLLYAAVLFAWVFGLFYALKGIEKPVPLLGKFYQKSLDFIK